MNKHKRWFPWGHESLSRLRGTHRPDSNPFVFRTTDGMRTGENSDGFGFHAGRRDSEPVFVVRRLTRTTARIETIDGDPYSDPMMIADAIALLNELSQP